MKISLRILLVLGLAFGLATTAFAQDSIGIGDTIEEEASGDPIMYEIEFEAGDMVAISLESDDFDTIVRLLDEDEEEVAENDDFDPPNLNSRLELEIEDSGTYFIVVDAFGTLEGDFELSVEALEADEEADEEESDSDDSGSAGDLTFDDEVEFDVDGEDELVVTFEASEGDVISLFVRSESGQDITIELFDPEDDSIVFADESFDVESLIRLLLEEDGMYRLVVLPFNSDEELTDEIEVELLETEILDLGEGPQSTEIDSNTERDVMVFEAEEDTVYILLFELDGDIDSSLFIDVLEEDMNFAEVSFTLRGTERAAFAFEPNDDGLVTIALDYFGFGSQELEITVEVDEE